MQPQLDNFYQNLGNFLKLNNLSVKQLSILGFSLVALPLIMSLLYSTVQISRLSTQGEVAIFDVAALIESNTQIASTLERMERFASQYIVLQDNDLKQQYFQQAQHLDSLLTQYRIENSDKRLQSLSQKFLKTVETVNQISQDDTQHRFTLEKIQKYFKELALTNQTINIRSNELITLHAKEIRDAANHINYMMLRSLLVIPFTIFIALFFVFLITTPLKNLISNIKNIERGKFANKVDFEGAEEVEEIALALEVMRARLHALELQKSSFIRHISHELKTPLAAIREGAELLFDHSVGDLNQDQTEVTVIIRKSVNRLQQLIEDLLNFNIVLDSTSLQDLEKIELSSLLSKVITDWKLDLKRKKLSVTSSGDAIGLTGNYKQISVIFDNLISNAIKYSPIGGSIDIHYQLKGSQVTITVKDSGSGFVEKDLNKVFSAFYQSRLPEDKSIKGSGLGLTIVKELLMRHQGDISLKNAKKPAVGAIAEVTLPKAFSRSE